MVSVEDKWAYEAHNHQVPAAVAAALSRVHELQVQIIKSFVTESRDADVLQSFQCELSRVTFKRGFGASVWAICY